jgi:hypothetical protein
MDLAPSNVESGHQRTLFHAWIAPEPLPIAGRFLVIKQRISRTNASGGSQMSDPRYEDPMSPSRGPYERAADGTSSLIVGTIIAALLVVFVIAFGMTGGEPSRTATSPAPETTGRSERAPAPPSAPLPANPNAATPQAAPDAPRPQ